MNFKKGFIIVAILLIGTVVYSTYTTNRVLDLEKEKSGLKHFYENMLITNSTSKMTDMYGDMVQLIDHDGDSLVFDADTLTIGEKRIIYDQYTRFQNYGKDSLIPYANLADSLHKVVEDSLNRIEN